MRTRRLFLAACCLPFLTALCLSPAQEKGKGKDKPKPPPEECKLPESWTKTLAWRSIGPANMGGRITALAVYEADPCIFYVATASGGLLKTINNGVTFEH